MKELIGRWKSQGIILFNFLDDILVQSNNKKITQTHTNIVLQDLEYMGWIIQGSISRLKKIHNIHSLTSQAKLCRAVVEDMINTSSSINIGQFNSSNITSQALKEGQKKRDPEDVELVLDSVISTRL